MSNQNSRPEEDTVLESLAVENDKRLRNFLMAFAIMGAGLISYMLTVEVIIPLALTTVDGNKDTKVVLKVNDIEKKKEEEKKKKNTPPKVRKRSGGGGPPKGRGIPNAPATQAALKLITSKSSSHSLSAYDLLNQKFAKDIDKVINNVSSLTTTGQTKIGARKGRADAGFNEGYGAGGSGGIDLDGLLGGGGGPVGVSARGGAGLKAPSASDIDMGQESGARSTESILRVIRTHTPGLRHTYNKYLKTNPGFKGKVTMKFTIAPSGSIIELVVVASTTGVSDFDSEIRDQIKSWKFESVKSKANDKVTVPFTFSE